MESFSLLGQTIDYVFLVFKLSSNSTFSLGKLEEEFERKFNSLPQYSPMTFDKKGTSVTKKKKTESSTAQEEVSKGGKGKNNSIIIPVYA